MTRKKWTSQEDQVLSDLIQRYGDKRGREGRWHDIAECLPGRTPKDCRKRWFHSLDPSLRKGRWSQEEDHILLREYSRVGPAWKHIALLLPGRKDDQCAKRYTEILAPSVHRRLQKWTTEEDAYLRAKVQEKGHSWSLISAGLPGRPPLTCRNRWRALAKAKSNANVQAGNVMDRAESIVQSDTSAGNDGTVDELFRFPQQSPHSFSSAENPTTGVGSLEPFFDESDFNFDLTDFNILPPAEVLNGTSLSDLAISGHAASLDPAFNNANEVGESHQRSPEQILELYSHVEVSDTHFEAPNRPASPNPGVSPFIETSGQSCTRTLFPGGAASSLADNNPIEPLTSPYSPNMALNPALPDFTDAGFTPPQTSTAEAAGFDAGTSSPRYPPSHSIVEVHHHVYHHHYHYHYHI